MAILVRMIMLGIFLIEGSQLIDAQKRVLRSSFTTVPPTNTNAVQGKQVETGKFGVIAISTPLRSTNPSIQTQEIGVLTGDLLVYPNPVNWAMGAELGYKLTGNGNVTLKVFNMRARLMGQRSFSKGAVGGVAGYNRIPLSSVISQSDIPGGAYFVILMIDSKIAGKTRFVVM